ncbi:MAG: hypothetical protein Q8R04_02210 [Nanoarchaeota archaeon]|nr:hypothetical protein [Nanoarchaeota archaeon]
MQKQKNLNFVDEKIEQATKIAASLGFNNLDSCLDFLIKNSERNENATRKTEMQAPEI